MDDSIRTRHPQWLEFATAALLALATVSTAWCTYEAARWSGIQARSYADAAAARVQASQLSNRALMLTMVDVGMFMQYARAVSDGNTHLEEFYLHRFRPEMKAAVAAWLATKPWTDPQAPPSPFAMPQYQSKAQDEAKQREQAAETKAEQAAAANQQSDDYILLTVLFASVLFFAGIDTKFRSRRLELLTFMLAVLVFVGSLAAVLTYPIA